MARPRLLLVPMLSEIEWVIKPQLEEWAEVASYDAPGVGDEHPVEDFGSDAVADRGLAELDRRGWDGCFVVADEFGIAAAAALATRRPQALQGLALGHARLSNNFEGDRPAMNREVYAAISQLIVTDYRSAIRQWSGLTGGEHAVGGYADEWTQRYLDRAPQALTAHFYSQRPEAGTLIGERLKELDCPLLLARHAGCLMFTPESFEDATAAFPEAQTVSVTTKPSNSSEFAEALRGWCKEIGA